MALLQAKFPSAEFTIKFTSSVADRDRVSEFNQFGSTGLFTQEPEEHLIRNECDLVVHSLKDLPTKVMDGLVLAAVPEREDPRDVVCGTKLDDLKPGARVGTASLRRRAQILALRPDLEIVPIRGNLQPRLGKLKGPNGLDAVILAAAGLKRLGLEADVAEYLDPQRFPYSVGQGALGVECRLSDPNIIAMLETIQCTKSRAEVEAERAMLHTLGAGCSLPVGVVSRWEEGGWLSIAAEVTALDGSDRIKANASGKREEARSIGVAVGEALKAKGGTKLLEESYRSHLPHFKLYGQRPAT
jgi:hydroxymethylbilane synthase